MDPHAPSCVIEECEEEEQQHATLDEPQAAQEEAPEAPEGERAEARPADETDDGGDPGASSQHTEEQPAAAAEFVPTEEEAAAIARADGLKAQGNALYGDERYEEAAEKYWEVCAFVAWSSWGGGARARVQWRRRRRRRRLREPVVTTQRAAHTHKHTQPEKNKGRRRGARRRAPPARRVPVQPRRRLPEAGQAARGGRPGRRRRRPRPWCVCRCVSCVCRHGSGRLLF
jgi:hypothetical protein